MRDGDPRRIIGAVFRLAAVLIATLASPIAPAQVPDSKTVAEVLARYSETSEGCAISKRTSELQSPEPIPDEASLRASAQMRRLHANDCICLPREIGAALAGRRADALISPDEFRPLFEHAAAVCNGRQLREQLAARCQAGRDPFTGAEPGGPAALRQRHCACLQGALKRVDDALLAGPRGQALFWYGDDERAGLAFDTPPAPMRDIEKLCRADDPPTP